MKHPLLVIIVIAVAVVAVVHVVLSVLPGEEPAALPPAAETAPVPVDGAGSRAASEAPVAAAPAGPVQAYDDFRYGLHLRYPLGWTTLSAAALPPGPPGSPIRIVGPEDARSALALVYVGVLVPRAGFEALARRSAEMAGLEAETGEWVVLARKRAFRLLARGEDRVEEYTFFSHRQLLMVVRLVAGGDEALAELRAVSGTLMLD